MLNRFSFGLLAALALVSCSGNETASDTPVAIETAAPEISEFPGAIPEECESLLKKSLDWGYRPGEKWAPTSAAQALEVVRYFGDFHFVPRASSTYFRNFLASPMPTSVETAAPQAIALSKVQVCDTNLAQSFLDGLVNYKWTAAGAPEAKSRIFQFVLNQQALVLPFLPRMVALDIYRKALSRGLVRGNAGAVKSLLERGEAERKKIGNPLTAGPISTLQQMKAELQLSESLKESLARSLPLP